MHPEEGSDVSVEGMRDWSAFEESQLLNLLYGIIIFKYVAIFFLNLLPNDILGYLHSRNKMIKAYIWRLK